MVNMLFTTFGILSPIAYNLFLILAVVGFFGIYIPWNEKRKQNGGKKPATKAGKWKELSAPMGRSQALVRMVFYIPVFVVGMTMLIASAVIGEPVMIALGGGLTIFSLLRMERAGRDFRAGRPSRPSKPPKPAFRPESTDHEHITVSGQGTKKRLEQLEVLKGAGIISDQEYQQRKREILDEPNT